MLLQPLYDKLKILRLPGVKEALQEQLQMPKYAELAFEDRLGLLIDHEMALRDERRLNKRIKDARFRERSACLADLDMSATRGLDKKLILSFSNGDWIRQHLNILITGATGVGKTYLGCALGRCACEQGFSVYYAKSIRLLSDLESARGDGSWSKLLNSIAKTRLLIFDDWFREPLTADQMRSLLEIFDDRWQRGSTILISQLPVQEWHSHLIEPTLADAILDRILHNSYQIEMQGESKRKTNFKKKDKI